MNRKLRDVRRESVSANVLIVLLIFSFFVIPVESPQVGTYINVGVFCEDTRRPVPEGLAVTVTGEGFTGTLYTDAQGYAGLFGSGLVDGTYVISFYWNGQYSYEVTIDCSQIVWTFDYYVANPVIIKHFVYDLEGYPPIEGLVVDLVDPTGAVVASATTDATGTVVFGGNFVSACVEYRLQWTWGSVLCSEGPIFFGYTDGQLLECRWECTNYLEPKTCGI